MTTSAFRKRTGVAERQPVEAPGRIASARRRIRRWPRAVQSRIELSRTRSSRVDAALVVQGRDQAVGGNLLACAIAFRVFLWLLPIALLVAAVLGFAEAAGTGEPEQMADDLGLAVTVTSIVAEAAEQAEPSRWAILALALFGVYTAGAAAAKTIAAVHQFAWGMPVHRVRGGPKASVAFTGIALVTIALTVAARWVRSEMPGRGLTAALVISVAYVALWVGVSAILPHADAPLVRLLPGAVFLGFGTQLIHLLTVYYLSGKIETASELYGGLGFAATLLLGLYFVSRLIVASALLNATLWERVRPRSPGVGGARTYPDSD